MIEVKDTVKIYGLLSFFYLLGTDNKVDYLVNEPRSFTLQELIAEYESRNIDEPSPILDSNSFERPSSDFDRVKYYDEYEKCDVFLFCLTIEILISTTLRDKTQVRFR